ncbi:MAG: ATP-grasp domain-containing protein [Methylococcaceae bacterium]|nr:ATP-grasp domain-containing protein [Methylococcaceae bacterium]
MNYTVIRSAISSLPSVGIIQLLQDNNIQVIGTDLSLMSAGANVVDTAYIVPKANVENEDFLIKKYSEIIKKNRVSSILSGPENEILYLAKYEHEFAKLSCNIFHPNLNALKIITDKYLLYKNVNEKLNCGEFYLANEFNATVCGNKNWILKPRNGRGSMGIQLLNKNNLSQNNSLLNEKNIIQEELRGQEFTVDFLCDFDGQLLNCVPRKREVIDSGIAVAATTVKNSELINLVKEICNIISFRGFNCIQFIEQKGCYFLTDLNPRIGGGSILSLRACASLKQNFINLLKSKPVKLNIDEGSFDTVSMFRYYSEIYKNTN